MSQGRDSWATTSPSPLSPNPAQALASATARSMSELRVLVHELRHAPVRSLSHSLVHLRLMDRHALELLGISGTTENWGAQQSLLNAGLVTELELEHARAHMLCTPEVDVLGFRIEPEALERLPWARANTHHVIPLGMDSGVLYVASATPLNRELALKLEIVVNCVVAMVWASRTQIEQRLAMQNFTASTLPASSFVAPDQSLSVQPIELPQELDVHALLTDALVEIRAYGGEEQLSAVNESSSVIKLVSKMISDAHAQNASDIHIETNPGDQVSRVRFRKDGDLEDYIELPFSLRSAVVSRIKIMSRLDISERRRPQDGKINFADFSNIKLELRVAILPTHDNLEDVVMRLLAASKPIALNKLGFNARDDQLIKKLAGRPFGLILACGPTGSGKTTTLHSLLAHINTDNRKIWTAEDPIEITQKGLRQLQVNPKIGVTFASAMRAFLRADPDVIMIGEVRDDETARVCIDASLTGHLVFSTLHTNSAAESVIRLLDLGLDPMNFGDSLVGVVAQRLVRSLCVHCARPQQLAESDYDELLNEYIDGTQLTLDQARARLQDVHAPNRGKEVVTALPILRHAVGCEHCGGRGYKGRTGIYEILENTRAMKQLIQSHATTSVMLTQAIADGMRTLRQDALEKVVSGVIDLPQARTVSA